MGKCGTCGDGLNKDCPECGITKYKEEREVPMSQRRKERREALVEQYGGSAITNRHERRKMKALKQ